MDKKKNKTSKRKSEIEEEPQIVKTKKQKKSSKSVEERKKTNKSKEKQKEIKREDVSSISKSSKLPKESKKTKENNKMDKNEKKKSIDNKKVKVTKVLEESKTLPSVSVSSNNVTSNNIGKFSEIRIYSWNVNGLRAMIGKGSLDQFIKNENPDILCLNETKIDQKTLQDLKYDKLYKDSYKSYWNCSERSGYAGVCVFTKLEPISVMNGIGIEKHDVEGRVITLEYESFYLISVYIPNAGQGLTRLSYRTQEWDPDFRNYLENLKKKKNVILCGDLNVAHEEIDLKNPKTNKKNAGFTIEERTEFTKLLEKGWIDTYRTLNPEKVQYTFWSARFNAREKNNGWRLDYFIINKEAEKNLVNSEILDSVMGSDHCPISLRYLI